MAQTKQNVRADGQAVFLGGANSGLDPALLGESQFAWGVNTTVRGGSIGPRPGFTKRTPVFDTTPNETAFQSGGKFQGASIHEGVEGNSVILSMVGGRLFVIEPDGAWNATQETPGTSNDDPNFPTSDSVNFQQAEFWTVVQNNLDAPIIYGDGSTRRAASLCCDEVPAGQHMAYGNGRLWLSKDRGYIAGDLVGSSSGGRPDKRDAILKFTENTFIAEGGSFALPINAGSVTGMEFISNLDTVLGEGDLVIFSRSGGFITQVPSDRTAWQNLNYPVQRYAIPVGAVSDRAIVNVNGDLYYRSPDGIRSLVLARREYGSPGNTPISEEVDRALKFDAPDLLHYSSAVLFDNRLLMTAVPQRTSIGAYHRGIVSLDFAPESFSGQTTAPAYDGMWTGLKFLQLVEGSFNGTSRCFVFVENEAGLIELWEIEKGAIVDNDGTDEQRIEWFFETRRFDFDSSWERKSLDRLELWLKDVRGTVDISTYFKPDESANWYAWKTWQEAAKEQFCDSDAVNGCIGIDPYNASYRPRVVLSNPQTTCEDLGNDKPINRGYTYQFRVQGTGSTRVSRIRAFCDVETEDIYRACPPETATQSTDATCPLDDYLAIP